MPKICTCCRVSKAKSYLYHNTKIVKAGPGFDDRPEYPSVQINSSKPWSDRSFNYVVPKISSKQTEILFQSTYR